MKELISLIKKMMLKKPDMMSNSEFNNLEFKSTINLEEQHFLNKLFMGKK